MTATNLHGASAAIRAVGLTLLVSIGLVAGVVLLPDLLLGRYPVLDIRIEGVRRDDVLREVHEKIAVMAPTLADADRVKAKLDGLAFVHHVDVRMAWPDRLIVSVQLQRAIALWNTEHFLNEAGEPFASEYFDRKLPQLYGPPDAAGAVMAQYRGLSKMLAGTGQTIEVLNLDELGRWEFENNLGIHVLLGREDTFARMRRLVDVLAAPAFGPRLAAVSVVDARYAHGLAIRWRTTDEEELVQNTNTRTEMSL